MKHSIKEKNGTIFPVEIRGFIFEEEEVKYSLAFVNNISSQKLKENEVKEHHEKYCNSKK
ncbi:MAG TPA: hypothetical protein DCQ93_09665 [Bacteroidetes bacterium]|nr:hypothetical protein [Bacteroidota bacterium]